MEPLAPILVVSSCMRYTMRSNEVLAIYGEANILVIDKFIAGGSDSRSAYWYLYYYYYYYYYSCR